MARATAKHLAESVTILLELTESKLQDPLVWDALTRSVEDAAAAGDAKLATKAVVKFVSAVIWGACHPKRGSAGKRRALTWTVLHWTNCE